jgi:hypothetical protein
MYPTVDMARSSTSKGKQRPTPRKTHEGNQTLLTGHPPKFIKKRQHNSILVVVRSILLNHNIGSLAIVRVALHRQIVRILQTKR